MPVDPDLTRRRFLLAALATALAACADRIDPTPRPLRSAGPTVAEPPPSPTASPLPGSPCRESSTQPDARALEGADGHADRSNHAPPVPRRRAGGRLVRPVTARRQHPRRGRADLLDPAVGRRGGSRPPPRARGDRRERRDLRPGHGRRPQPPHDARRRPLDRPWPRQPGGRHPGRRTERPPADLRGRALGAGRGRAAGRRPRGRPGSCPQPGRPRSLGGERPAVAPPHPRGGHVAHPDRKPAGRPDGRGAERRPAPRRGRTPARPRRGPRQALPRRPRRGYRAMVGRRGAARRPHGA